MMKKTIYLAKSDPEKIVWKKDIEILDGKIIHETLWTMSHKQSEQSSDFSPISHEEELLLINNEMYKIKRKILSCVSLELEDELEQKLDVFRKRRYNLLSQMGR